MVPCFACEQCAVDDGVGFGRPRLMMCTARGDEAVSQSDGCTLGTPGEPMTACRPAEIYYTENLAVWG